MKNNEMKRAYKNNIFYKISKFLDERFNNLVNENVFTAYFNGVNEKYFYIEEGYHKPYEKRKIYDSKCHMFNAHSIFDFTKAIVDYLGFDNYYIYPYEDDPEYEEHISEYISNNENRVFEVNHYVETTVELKDNTKTIHFEIDGVFRFSVECYVYNKFASFVVFNTLYSKLIEYFTFLCVDKNLYKEVVKARKEDKLVYAIANSCIEENTDSIINKEKED